MVKSGKTLLFYSQYAFLRSLYEVFETVCADCRVQGFIITHERAPIAKAYEARGYLTHESAGLAELPEFATVIPGKLANSEALALLKKKVEEMRPDYIWAHAEPDDTFVNEMLRWYYRKPTPRIVVPVVQNIWRVPGGNRARIARLQRSRLWRRYNGVLACATKSAVAIREYGMPEGVPIVTAWLPTVAPTEPTGDGGATLLPRREKGEFFVGFAGRIAAAKGWRVLLAAMTQLPEHFRCVIAGTGEEEAELRLWCQVPAIGSRVRYLGVLKKDHLWDFYRSIDVFALPSLTTESWCEQFGQVLAEAMACGLPVIGSDSGAIPEVVGDCGIVVEENNSAALAKAIEELASDAGRRKACAKAGLERFRTEYSVQAYAKKLATALGLRA